jgi:transposase
MRRASNRIPESAEKTVRDIRRATRRHHSAEEKIRIVLEGLRGEVSIAELCRKEESDKCASGANTKFDCGIASNGRLAQQDCIHASGLLYQNVITSAWKARC